MNPIRAIAIGIKVKTNRCRSRSEQKAITIEKPNAAAQGGMEYSWVLIAL